MLNLERKKKIIYYQIYLIGLNFLLLLIYLIISLADKFLLIWSSLLGKLEAICGCSSHFTFSNHPYIFSFLILTGLLLAVFLSFIITKIVIINRSTRKFINSNLKNKSRQISKKLEKAARSLNLEKRITEIESNNFIIFCYGFFRPKICVSKKLSKNLNSEELATVLLHEQHHLINSEPRKLFIIKVITKILFFVPKLKPLARQYIVASELVADEWAIKRSKNKSSLASALYKALTMKEMAAGQEVLALPFFNSITDERITKMISKNYSYSYQLFSSKLIFICFFLISIILFSNLFLYSVKTAVAKRYETGACSAVGDNIMPSCQMEAGISDCGLDGSLPAKDYQCSMADGAGEITCSGVDN